MDVKVIESGEWQTHTLLTDYRAEWPGDMLVERATWTQNAPTDSLPVRGDSPVLIAGPSYIWFRFWLSDDQQVVDRYFDSEGHAIGTYVPICQPLTKEGQIYRTEGLLLGLWIGADGQVTVLHEEEFDEAVSSQSLSPVDIDRAETRIRSLTLAVAQKRFPPALVRNFTINIGGNQSGSDQPESGPEADILLSSEQQTDSR
ncbi:MAG: DUF402 domain-containing protein [Chloroflexota bacterium]